MSLNITIDGYVYNSTGDLAGDKVSYQAFWYPNGTASSSAKWNTVRTSEDSSYWNCNLGDADFLGQNGIALDGGIVLVAFWIGGNDRLADCGAMIEWGAFEFSLDSRSFYSYDVQVKANILPNLSWSNNIPSHAYVGSTYNFINNSTDIHSWDFNGLTMNHWYTRYGFVINNTNVISETDYVYGDGESDLNLSGAANASHVWDSAGTYSITITIRDACGDDVSETITQEIYWSAPAPNITRCDASGNALPNTIEAPDTPVYFKYIGTDPDSTIVSIEWHISDSGVYGDTDTLITTGDTSAVIEHTAGLGTSWNEHAATSGAFTNPGSHTVTVVITWYDGYQNQTITYNEAFNQMRFDNPPVPNIVCNEAIANHVTTPSTTITFNYTGTDPEDRITTIDWTIYDSGPYGNTDSEINDKLKTDTISHTNGEGASWCGNSYTNGAFTNPGNHLVEIEVNWNDGWDDNVLIYSETITQGKFTGPNLNFKQIPSYAGVNTQVLFENTSTSTDRVGLALPDCEKYSWQWEDSGQVFDVDNVDYSYNLIKTPHSVTCKAKLCADWSDGWETLTDCVSKDIVFKTTVTVTPEACYYLINIIGTSTDGTASSYGWTVSSGTSVSGTFSEVWRSPIAEDQQDKTLCFSSTGWYKIEGTVYGNGQPTSDFKTLYIDETCPDIGSKYVLWNGTGPLDAGGDWQRDGIGVESIDAVYQGTNGLLLASSNEGTAIFTSRGNIEVNISNYDFLSFWVNVREWRHSKDIKIKLYSTLRPTKTELNLSSYINFNFFEEWRRVMIPLRNFKIARDKSKTDWPTYVNKLTFEVDAGVDIWVDNIALIVGELVTLPVCGPNPSALPIDSIKKDEELPNIRLVPAPMPDFSPQITEGDGTPSIVLNTIKPMYPQPKNTT